MSDLPPGAFSEILVGQHWPSAPAMAAVYDAVANRGGAHTEFSMFAEQLRQIRSGPLADQSGITADRIRDTFDQGAQTAQSIADVNSAKQGAYHAAHSVADDLRDALTTIAEDGNTKIDQIRNAKGSAAEKIAQITEVVVDAQTRANTKAATCAGEILDAMQGIFAKQGIATSAREFASEHGLDVQAMFQAPNREAINARLTSFLGTPERPAEPPPGLDESFIGSLQSETVYNEARINPSANSVGCLQAETPVVHTADTLGIPTKSFVGELQTASPPSPPITAQPPAPVPAPVAAPAVPTPVAAPAVATSGATAAATPGGTTVVAPAGPALTTSPATPHPTSPTPGAPLPTVSSTPPGLLHSFEHGLQTGSAVPHGLFGSAPIAGPVDTHATAVAGAVAPPHVPAYAGSPIDFPQPQPTDAASPYLAAPVGAQPALIPASATATPAVAPGVLPGYGADLRPPAAASATAPSAPPPAQPAPVTTSATGSGVGQPAVVRRTIPAQPATAITEQAVAATATGAAAGALSAEASARARLQALVYAMARQEPRLRWVAGDRADGTTVLVTDLAGGWVPPHLAVPAAVELVTPEQRRRSIAGLLGDVTVTAEFRPGQHVADPINPIPTAPGARCSTEIAELGWELHRATAWRDGLPRLAHTLVDATCRRTGVLDSEIALLREHLNTVSERVLGGYPDDIDPESLANCQLLAAIDALLGGERHTATYHFAWYHAGLENGSV